MQIHELTQRQPVNEGLLGAVGSLAKNAMGVKSTGAAGISDPEKKLAAVKKQPELVKMAQGWADEWIKQQKTPQTEAVTARGGATPAEIANLEKQIAAQQAALQEPAQPQTTAQPAADPKKEYLNSFLAFANNKIAMRDPTTYEVIALQAVEKSGLLKDQLEKAEGAVGAAQGNEAATKAAVVDYMLTALAGAQLLITNNKLNRSKLSVPAYGSKPDTAPTTATQLVNQDMNALFTDVGLPPALLGQAGKKFQQLSRNTRLSTTGDRVADSLLRSMGYRIS